MIEVSRAAPHYTGPMRGGQPWGPMSLAAVALLSACATEPTQVVVRVATDMAAPGELGALRLSIYDGTDLDGDRDDAPLREELLDVLSVPGDGRFHTVGTFGVTPAGGDASRRFEIRATALRAPTQPLFETRAISGFVRRRTIRLDLYVPGRCVETARACRPDQTCGVSGCVDPEVPAESLPPLAEVDPEPDPEDPRSPPASIDLLRPVSGSVVTSRQIVATLPGPDSTDARLYFCPTSACLGEVPSVPFVEGRAELSLVDGERYYLTPERTLSDGSTREGAQVFVEVHAPSGAVRDTTCGQRLDLSVDGVPDVVVGDPGAGRVHVRTRTPAEWEETVLVAPDGAGGFGRAVAAAGDVDGDGKPDLIVGAPEGGAAFVFRGGHLTEAPYALGIDAPERFGGAVAGGSDLDGDGFSDVAVAAVAADGSWRVGVYLGGPAGPGPDPDAVIVGPSGARSASGVSLAAGGDVIGDGRGDLVIGAPGANATAGVAFAVSAEDGFELRPLFGTEAPAPGDRFGAQVALGLVAIDPSSCAIVITAPGRARGRGGAFVVDAHVETTAQRHTGGGAMGSSTGEDLVVGRISRGGDSILMPELALGVWRVNVERRAGSSDVGLPGISAARVRLSLPGDLLGDDADSELLVATPDGLTLFTDVADGLRSVVEVAAPPDAVDHGASVR